MKKVFTSLLIAFIISFAFYIPKIYANNNMINDATNTTRNVVQGTENAVEDKAKGTARSN